MSMPFECSADVSPQLVAKIGERLKLVRKDLTFDPVWGLFSSIYVGMTTIVSDAIPTAGTNGKYAVYNPLFCKELTDDMLRFLVIHETLHVVLKHVVPARYENKDRDDWNAAGDYVINYWEIMSGYFKRATIEWVKETGLFDEQLYEDGEGNADKIYRILLARKRRPPVGRGRSKPNPDGEPGPGRGNPDPNGKPKMVDDCTLPYIDGEDSYQVEVAVDQAMQKARKSDHFGKLPSSLRRLIEESDRTEAPWASVLEDYALPDSIERSWARPNRRFASQGIYLPSLQGERCGTIGLLMDASGSITSDVLNQKASEINDVIYRFNPERLVVISHDTKAYLVGEYFDGQEPDFSKVKGGGGTSFVAALEMVADYDPDVVISLTDLAGMFPQEEPDFPVVWVSTYKDYAPFGRVVMVND